MTPDPHTALRNAPLLRGTPPEVTASLLASGTRRALHADEQLLAPGELNSTIYLLLEGRLHVRLSAAHETKITVAPGECVGEMSVIDGGKVSAGVFAAQPGEVLAVDVDTLWRLTEHHPIVARNLLSIMTRRVRQVSAALVDEMLAHEKEGLLARLDTLTSVYNRRWLDENLPSHLERARATRSHIVVGLLDIDYFKHYNDNWGHAAGDAALRATAKVIREQIRPLDQIARYGGEEFCLLLPDTRLEHSSTLAQRLLEAVSGNSITGNGGESLPSVTISLGLAESTPADTAESVLRRADDALYSAKHAGRNRFTLNDRG